MKKRMLAMLLLGWLGAACVVAPRPTAIPLSIDLLLINESVFPEGWEAEEPNWQHPPRAPWSGRSRMIEYIDRSFYTHEGKGATARMEIRQFDSETAAHNRYNRDVDVQFQIRDEWSTPWFIPEELSFKSQIADQYRHGCQIAGYYPQLACAYVAQYDVYVLDFDAAIYDTSVLTYTDLLDVLQVIDERFVFALNDK